MIQASGIRVRLSELDGSDETERAAVREALRRRLHVAPDDITSVERRRRSIDARKRDDVHLTFTVIATVRGGANAERALLDKLARRGQDRGVSVFEETPFLLPRQVSRQPDERPVVIGAGCAGLFCALALANAGLRPILVERGDDARRRGAHVREFERTGELDRESNIQFGLGGAGTFSDGKLQTGTKSPSHRLILETFADAGAARDILWDARPHIGSDVLPQVVEGILARIVSLGGEARMRTRLVDVSIAHGSIDSVTLESVDAATGVRRRERLACNHVVLACGHSARDVFELLKGKEVTLERKTFAMGVRIEHSQASVDRAQYGRFAGDPALGPAPYKLVCHLPQGGSAFSFCMCPGGYVVAAASEPEGVVTNGMSRAAREGTNANSGLLANVGPQDLPGDDPLEGVYLQRRCEQAAFRAGGGGFAAPAQLVSDFLAGRPSSGPGSVTPTYPRGVSWGDVSTCLPENVAETLRAAIPRLERSLAGFSAPDAVLTGIESRSSSPVRITRGADGQSVSCRGLFPVGEGAGYAGGIMSAAADGLRGAEALISSIEEGR